MGTKPSSSDEPMERRLQTLAAGLWFIVFAFGGYISALISVYIVLFTKYYYLMILYYIWIYLDRKTAFTGGRRFEWVRDLAWWRYNRDYFPTSLVKTADLPTNKNYLFCVYPHGVYSSGAFCNFLTNANNFKKVFPGIDSKFLTLGLNFLMPFTRELLLALGFISVSESSIMNVLKNSKGGTALVLVPGGVEEGYYSKPETYLIILKKRKGFVRLALKTGTSLVPVLSFGETSLFDQLEWLQNIIKKLFGAKISIPNGRGIFQESFGLIPRRHKVTTVVGKPIATPIVEQPSPELIDEYHKKFTDELTKLFEETKMKYEDDPKSKKLVIQ